MRLGRSRHGARRRAGLALVIAPLAALALSACSTSLGSWSATTGTTHHDVDDILVTGASGKQPSVQVPTPFTVTKTVRKVLDTGDGAVVKSGQRVTVQYVGLNGTDGKIFDTSWTRDPASFVVGESSYIMKGVVDGLIGVPVGSRVLVAVTSADAYGVSGAADRGIGPTDTIIFVMDIKSARVVLAKATGTAQQQKASRPLVTRSKKGVPKITVRGKAPSSLVAAVVIKGHGTKVAKGDSITVQYVGEVWSTRRVFDSSWKNDAPSTFTIGTGQVITGWDQGLVGQTVGSQVLLLVPPDDGYGAAGKSSMGIRGTDVLIFVVDILDAA